MKTIVLSVFLLLISSCHKQNSTLRIKVEQSENLTDENFEVFFNKFISDSTFQISKVNFPIKVVELDTDNLKEDTLELNQTNYYFQEIAKESRDYNIEKSIYKDSTKIILKGIDNGIYKEISFFKDDGKWKLKTWSDLST